MGVTRQIFFAGLGNFDTHSETANPSERPAGASQFSDGGLLPGHRGARLADQITTFTMSDFSRALQPNSNTGSDHAWGGHHMVMGGAVKGGKDLRHLSRRSSLGGPNDSDINGRWVADHLPRRNMRATLASWFGVLQRQPGHHFPLALQLRHHQLGFRLERDSNLGRGSDQAALYASVLSLIRAASFGKP